MIWIGVVVCDGPFRSQIENSIGNFDELSCCFSISNLDQLNEKLEDGFVPNYLVVFSREYETRELDKLISLGEQYPYIETILVSNKLDPDFIYKAFESGIKGLLLHPLSADDVLNAIQIIGNGGAAISPQIARHLIDDIHSKNRNSLAVSKPNVLTVKEQEIVLGLVDGLSYKGIADRLAISIETVRFHIRNIYQKLDVHTKVEVVSKSFKGEI